MQICRNLCTSTFVYMITKARAGLGVRINLKAKTSPRSKFRKPKIAKYSVLVGLLPFAIVLLSCVEVLLEAENLSSLVKIAEPC